MGCGASGVTARVFDDPNSAGFPTNQGLQDAWSERDPQIIPRHTTESDQCRDDATLAAALASSLDAALAAAALGSSSEAALVPPVPPAEEADFGRGSAGGGSSASGVCVKTDENEAGDNEDDDGDIEIFIMFATGKAITLNVEAADTINTVKKNIKNKEGIPRNQQRLIFGGLELENDRTLAAYGILDGFTIILDDRPQAQASHGVPSQQVSQGVPSQSDPASCTVVHPASSPFDSPSDHHSKLHPTTSTAASSTDDRSPPFISTAVSSKEDSSERERVQPERIPSPDEQEIMEVSELLPLAMLRQISGTDPDGPAPPSPCGPVSHDVVAQQWHSILWDSPATVAASAETDSNVQSSIECAPASPANCADVVPASIQEAAMSAAPAETKSEQDAAIAAADAAAAAPRRF